MKALYYLRRFFEIEPQDPQTIYGLAFAYMETEAPQELHVLARDDLGETAASELKAKGPRSDAAFYCGMFYCPSKKSFQEIIEIGSISFI